LMAEKTILEFKPAWWLEQIGYEGCKQVDDRQNETSPPKFSAPGGGRCRAVGRLALRFGARLSVASRALDRLRRAPKRHRRVNHRPTAEERRVGVQHQNEPVFMADVTLRDERGDGGRPHRRAKGHGKNDVEVASRKKKPRPNAWRGLRCVGP